MKFRLAAKLFAPKANPIGVDFGSDALRLAQVQWSSGEPRLIAAATQDVPEHVRHDPAARLAFFVQATREMLAAGKFRGKQAVLGLPIAQMFIQHLRMSKMDDEATRKALPWEARGKLPIDPSHAVLRHLVAGEVFQDQEARNEIILMAASRDTVNRYIAAASKARLDVVGMNVEPLSVLDCVSHVHRRKTDRTQTTCIVDVGASGSRAYIVREGRLLFARMIAIGGDHFSRAVSTELNISLDEARMLRCKLAGADGAVDPTSAPGATETRMAANAGSAETQDGSGFAILGAALAKARADDVGEATHGGESSQGSEAWQGSEALNGSTAPEVGSPVPPELAQSETGPMSGDASVNEPRVDSLCLRDEEPDAAVGISTIDPRQQALLVAQACAAVVVRLVEELNLCRRYYESTWPSNPVQRLLFVGGEARQRALCQQVARQMALSAQVVDPVARLGRGVDLPPDCGIDRRTLQPGWTVAAGLSLGPVAAAAANAA